MLDVAFSDMDFHITNYLDLLKKKNLKRQNALLHCTSRVQEKAESMAYTWECASVIVLYQTWCPFFFPLDVCHYHCLYIVKVKRLVPLNR